MMYLWNSGIWASGAVWGCQWTEASIPHPSWTPPESSSLLQSHRIWKKKLSKKRKHFILVFSAITPSLSSSTTLSVKTTSSTLSGCFCRQPPPPYSFILTFMTTQSTIPSTNHQGIWNWVCKQSWNEAIENWFSGQMVNLHSPKVGKKTMLVMTMISCGEQSLFFCLLSVW